MESDGNDVTSVLNGSVVGTLGDWFNSMEDRSVGPDRGGILPSGDDDNGGDLKTL